MKLKEQTAIPYLYIGQLCKTYLKLFIFFIANYLIWGLPPGYNPNMNIEEQRRNQIRQKQAEDQKDQNTAKDFFEKDNRLALNVTAKNIISGEILNSNVNIMYRKTGRIIASKKKKEHVITVEKFSDLIIKCKSDNHVQGMLYQTLANIQPFESINLVCLMLPRNKDNKSYEILFDPDSSSIKEEYNDWITATASALYANPGSMVIINGYAALSDDPGKTEKVALERAEGVQRKLIALGIPQDMIKIFAIGVDTTLAQDENQRKFRADVFFIEAD